MAVYLVCEGPTDGLDVRVLDLVIAQKLGKPALIIPAGGDSSLGSVATYFEERSRERNANGQLGRPSDRAYAIEDRDYRPLPAIEEAWQQAEKKRLHWRRHEIENYLLHPRIVAEAFQDLKRDSVRGANDLPKDEGEVFAALQDMARPMIEDHAGWLTYWRLRTAKDQESGTWFRAKHPRFPGGRAEWLSHLHDECARLKASTAVLGTNPAFDDVATAYDECLAGVSTPEFFTGGQFLCDFGGHQLMAALCTFVKKKGLVQLVGCRFGR